MYKILCDNVVMCDSRIEELALINPVVTLEENKAGSFSFIIPPEHQMYDSVQKRKSLIEVYQDDETEPFFSGICIEETKDFYKQKKIYCEGELTFFNDSIQRPARYQNVSVRGLLEAYIDNHNSQVEESKRFVVGQVTVTDVNDSLYCYTNMESTMKCLKEDLVDDLGGFFRIRHVGGVRYLDYLAESPNTNTQGIKIGKNLLDFTTNTDASEIATAIIPLGCKLEESSVEGLDVRLTIESVNDGKDYVFSQDAVNNYGWIYKTVEWDDVTTPEALKSKGEKYLSDIQYENMVIQAKAVDLHLTDKDIERFKISDQIRVVSTPHGLNRYFKLSRLTVDLNNPEKNSITLGKDERLTLSAKTNQENEAIKNAIKEISPSTILNSAIENATQLIQKSMNGYITTTTDENGVPTELLIMDTPNKETATKVWRWNINGLGYSSNGYYGDYGLAMTMDGSIVADKITTGTMVADRIKGGTLTLGGSDNTSGVLDLLDAIGNSIVKLDKEGITLADGASLISASGVCGDLTFVSNGGSPEWLGFRPDSLADGSGTKAELMINAFIPDNYVIKSAKLYLTGISVIWEYERGEMIGQAENVKLFVGGNNIKRYAVYPGGYWDCSVNIGEQIVSGQFVAEGANPYWGGVQDSRTISTNDISSYLKNGQNTLIISPEDFYSESEFDYLYRTGAGIAMLVVKGYTKN